MNMMLNYSVVLIYLYINILTSTLVYICTIHYNTNKILIEK